ncbi:MAG: hypothetical protein LBD16_06415 [Oscillospiraceae bacterium]|jgi:hypothetical protein|nr:hypothetical protein [Oscillospiraceae bacterium]
MQQDYTMLKIPMTATLLAAVEEQYQKMGTTFAEVVRSIAIRSLSLPVMPVRAEKCKARGMAREYANPALIPLEEAAMAE